MWEVRTSLRSLLNGQLLKEYLDVTQLYKLGSYKYLFMEFSYQPEGVVESLEELNKNKIT